MTWPSSDPEFLRQWEEHKQRTLAWRRYSCGPDRRPTRTLREERAAEKKAAERDNAERNLEVNPF